MARQPFLLVAAVATLRMHVSILSYPCPSMMSIGGQVGLRRSHHLDHLLSCCIMQACKNTCMSAKATVEASASFLSIYLSFLHVHRFWHRTERPEAHQTALNKITRCTLDTAHCTLHTTHCTLHTAHCTLHTAHCTLHTTHCTLYLRRVTSPCFGLKSYMA